MINAGAAPNLLNMTRATSESTIQLLVSACVQRIAEHGSTDAAQALPVLLQGKPKAQLAWRSQPFS